jgi:hypothetical protein
VTKFELQAIVRATGTVIRDYVAKQLADRDTRIAPIAARVDALETQKSGGDLASLLARVEAIENRPMMQHLGTYQAGTTYTRGNCVTDRGCCWTCKVDATTIRPDFTPHAAAAWSLIAKAGRDGKDLR